MLLCKRVTEDKLMHSNDNRFSTMLVLGLETKMNEIVKFNYIDKIFICIRHSLLHCLCEYSDTVFVSTQSQQGLEE